MVRLSSRICCCLVLLALAAPTAYAQTDESGFPLQYLVLGPYANTGGANPGPDAQAEDYLCDGDIGEEDIEPEDGLKLGQPDAGGCAKADTSFLDPCDDPVIQTASANNTTLDLNTLFTPNDNTMAYWWVYVINNSGEDRDVELGVSSDDGIQVKVNGEEVHNNSVPRGCGGAGVIQDPAIPITLLEGVNLIQGKVFEGGGGWCTRMQLFDPETFEPIIDDGSGDGDFTITVEKPGDSQFSAERTIVRDGDEITVTLGISSGGMSYSLSERFAESWTVSDVTGGGEATGAGIFWDGVMEDTLTYKLTAAGDCTAEEGRISGRLTVDDQNRGVRGDQSVPGCDAAGFVPDVLVTPAFLIKGPSQGCDVPADLIAGEWVGGNLDEPDGPVFDSRSFVPEAELVFYPDYENNNAGGLVPIDPLQAELFWTAPEDALESGAILVPVTSNGAGFYDWQRADIYGADPSDTMNVAYFYAINNGDSPRCVWMGLGSDDSVGIKVNGYPVFANTVCRGHPGFTDKTRIQLDPGKNLVAISTYENGGGWNLCVRFEDSNGVPIFVETTLDPDGYDPAARPEPDRDCSPIVGTDVGDVPSVNAFGFITQWLVPAHVLDQSFGANAPADTLPEDWIQVVGDGGLEEPTADNIREGAEMDAGIGVSDRVRGGFSDGSSCGTTRLVLFQGSGTDSGLFNGEVFYGNPDNYTISAFAFLNNVSGGPLDAFIGFASDDAAALFVDGELILQHLAGRGFGGANQIQTGPAAITLKPGISLLQLSYTEGGGGSGFRVQITGGCGDATVFPENQLVVSANPPGIEGGAIRTIAVADQGIEADISVAVDRGGEANYSLTESFPAGWTVSDVTEGGVAGANSVSWTNVTAASVSYKLSRETPCTPGDGTVSGSLELGADIFSVKGDAVISSCTANPFVSEVLVTPSMKMAFTEGCAVTVDEIEGEWITGDSEDGGIDDRSIIPREGMQILPEFGGDPQVSGWDECMTGEGGDRFLTDPFDLVGSNGIIAKVSNTRGDGLFDWQAGSIYGDAIFPTDCNQTMNIAFFYVVNPTDTTWVVNMAYGSDDSGGARVNGYPVNSIAACRGHPGYAVKFQVPLDPGKNLISIYTFENGGGYNMCVRFEDENGNGIFVPTTTDPEGYDPDAHDPPDVGPPGGEGNISPQGFIATWLVPTSPFDQPFGANSLAGALPEDYITIDGETPDADNVREGAPVGPGSTGNITTAIRDIGNGADSELVEFNGFDDPAATIGDPGLFDASLYYGDQDDYSTTGFTYLINQTAAPVEAYIGFASDDSAHLFLNGELVLEHIGGRGYGGANTIQTGPALVSIPPGANLLQMSFTDGCCGSGFRVAIYSNCAGTETFDSNVLDASTSPEIQPPGDEIKRGDVNNDGGVNIADAIFMLNDLFGDGSAPTCLETADVNGDTGYNIADAIFLLNNLFGDGPPPIGGHGPRGADCGPDPEPASSLGCVFYDKC